ncbi:MAG TPA: hypothetical protein VL025_16290 [Thermoanaerobaculia bacterium]|nr:hypothetical protein [Thermoanaerobaculia bacterium]
MRYERRRAGLRFLVLGLLILAACAAPAPPPPVPVRGGPVDLTLLAGEWNGEYFGAETGRSGTIRLDLTAGEAIAYGEVVMYDPGHRPLVPAGLDRQEERPSTQALSIRFVAVDEGIVSGSLEPYHDPECGECIVTTIFTGRVRGNVIEGTYVTHGGQAHPTTRGSWRVERAENKAS